MTSLTTSFRASPLTRGAFRGAVMNRSAKGYVPPRRRFFRDAELRRVLFEVRRLKRAKARAYLPMIVPFLVATGLRSRELSSLHPEDISPSFDYIHVAGRGVRVFVPRSVRFVLQLLLLTGRERLLKDYPEVDMERDFAEATLRAGYGACRLSSLRYTCGVRMLIEGAHPGLVAKHLGLSAEASVMPHLREAISQHALLAGSFEARC